MKMQDLSEHLDEVQRKIGYRFNNIDLLFQANLYVLIVVVSMAKRYGIQQASIEDKSTNAMTSLTRVTQNAKRLQLLKMMSLQGSLKHTQRSWAIKVRSFLIVRI